MKVTKLSRLESCQGTVRANNQIWSSCKIWRWLEEAAENWPAWCKKSYEKEGYACGFWHTTRALIYTQKGLCHSQRYKQISNWCKGVSSHMTGENVW